MKKERWEPKHRLKRKNYSDMEIASLAELSVSWNARMQIFDAEGKRVMVIEPQNRIR